MNCLISNMNAADWPEVMEIYQCGISTGSATFAENSTRCWQEWDEKHLPECRLTARRQEEVLGWAALTPISTRAVYAGVAEVSIYVADHARGQGIGSLLLSALVAASETNGIWTLQSSIFPENTASLRLHQTFGFREVGRRERIGKMTYGPFSGKWRDTLLLERRSSSVGIV